MRIHKLATRQFPILETVICNNCGKKVSIDDADPEPYLINQMHSFEIEGGYASIFDYMKLKFDICDNCMDNLIKNFKVECEIETLF